MNATLRMIAECARRQDGRALVCTTCGEPTSVPLFKHLPVQCALCAIRADVAKESC